MTENVRIFKMTGIPYYDGILEPAFHEAIKT